MAWDTGVCGVEGAGRTAKSLFPHRIITVTSEPNSLISDRRCKESKETLQLMEP
jgi:hypothetical protein